MLSKIILAALVAGTALTVAYYPQQNNTAPPINQPTQNVITNERPKIEVVFVLDTTGSMDGLIQTAKEKIWSIATTFSQAKPAPDIKMGLVAFRDRGDDYVTKTTNLSENLDAVYATLMDYQAHGGGDHPESVNKALYDAVNTMSWSQDQNTYKAIFLVGDAPPQMNYTDELKYPEIVKMAKQQGIVINTIQCGNAQETTKPWNRIAKLSGGEYLQVAQEGGALAMSTPFDHDIATLSEELDQTRLYYGTPEVLEEKEQKLQATKKLHEAASIESRARRATFNLSKSGESNLFGDNELVNDVITGRVDLEDVAPSSLPAPIKNLPIEEQHALIKEKAKQRDELKHKIQNLSDQRKEYLKAEAAKRDESKTSLDHKLYDVVREQVKSKGIEYHTDAPAY